MYNILVCFVKCFFSFKGKRRRKFVLDRNLFVIILLLMFRRNICKWGDCRECGGVCNFKMKS